LPKKVKKEPLAGASEEPSEKTEKYGYLEYRKKHAISLL
jgi:hypothetical protein